MNLLPKSIIAMGITAQIKAADGVVINLNIPSPLLIKLAAFIPLFFGFALLKSQLSKQTNSDSKSKHFISFLVGISMVGIGFIGLVATHLII